MHPQLPLQTATTLFKEWSSYLKPEDVERLETAYHFSEVAHTGQYRESGDPYISHPLAVASILAQLHLDPQALTAALLHDVMEDTSVTKAEIGKKFGKPVAELVDGVSKLDKIEFETHEEAQAENFRKMLLAMARDVRVILIKLADRLHNMRTLDAVPLLKRQRIARETLEIYAPIANRLGLTATTITLDTPGASQTASYHAEISVPAESDRISNSPFRSRTRSFIPAKPTPTLVPFSLKLWTISGGRPIP